MQHKNKVFLKDISLGFLIFAGLAWAFWYRYDMPLLASLILAGIITPIGWLIKMVSREFSK